MTHRLTKNLALALKISGACIGFTMMTACANADLAASNQDAAQLAQLEASAHALHSDHLKTQAPHELGYQKPGAAVRFSHSYDGKSNSGDIENFTLTLTDSYDGGMLNVKIKAQDGLTYYSSAREFNFSMTGDNAHVIDLQIGTPNAGKHLLNVSSVVELPNGHSLRRSNAVAFYVGGEVLSKSSSSQDAISRAQPSGGVIVMDAQEEIIKRQ